MNYNKTNISFADLFIPILILGIFMSNTGLFYVDFPEVNTYIEFVDVNNPSTDEEELRDDEKLEFSMNSFFIRTSFAYMTIDKFRNNHIFNSKSFFVDVTPSSSTGLSIRISKGKALLYFVSS